MRPTSRSKGTPYLAAALGVWVFVAYYSTADHATTQNGAPEVAMTSVWNGVFTDEQAKRGEALYLQACASCHADDLRGVEYAPPLRVDFFVSGWGLGLTTIGELFDRIVASMPKEKPGSLARQAYGDILAHILRTNNFPSGQQELVPDAAILRRIRLTAAPPQ
jgi:cytochrome c